MYFSFDNILCQEYIHIVLVFPNQSYYFVLRKKFLFKDFQENNPNKKTQLYLFLLVRKLEHCFSIFLASCIHFTFPMVLYTALAGSTMFDLFVRWNSAIIIQKNSMILIN